MGIRQGRPGGNLDRSSAFQHGRDNSHAKARIPVAHGCGRSLPLALAVRVYWRISVGPTRPMTWDELVAEMDKKLRLPGVVNAWTMPIKNRIDMLSTGIRTPIGIKIFGPDLAKIEEIGKNIEAACK